VGIIEPDAPCDEGRLVEAEQAIQAKCREREIGVCVGTETPKPNGKPYNSALIVDPNGEMVARHHKSRLTPKDELGYSAGEGPTLFEFNGIPMGVVICFEGFRFPETSRELAARGAKAILHPQFNHVLPGADWKLPVHHALITARAAEDTLYFVSANMAHERNNCRSLIVAPDGLIAARSELGQEMLIHADADLERSTNAFLHSDSESRIAMLAEAG
jgi:predicted amidohydrolase